jgi:hypothetical protein
MTPTRCTHPLGSEPESEGNVLFSRWLGKSGACITCWVILPWITDAEYRCKSVGVVVGANKVGVLDEAGCFVRFWCLHVILFSLCVLCTWCVGCGVYMRYVRYELSGRWFGEGLDGGFMGVYLCRRFELPKN